jgi:hypothetical protein
LNKLFIAVSRRPVARSFYNPMNINALKIHLTKPNTEEEILKTRNLHISWITSLPTNAIVIYSDGSRSSTGSVGAGWIIYRKLQVLKLYKKISVTLAAAWKYLMQNYMLHMKGFNVLLVEIFVIQDYVLIIAKQLMFLLTIQIELKKHSRQQMLGIH